MIYSFIILDWGRGREGQRGSSHLQGLAGQETNLPEVDWPHWGDSAKGGRRRDKRVQINHQQVGGMYREMFESVFKGIYNGGPDWNLNLCHFSVSP